VAALVVLADFGLVRRGDYSYLGLRATVPLLALVPYLILARGDLDPVGLRVRPLPCVRYWFRATFLIGVAIGTVIVAAVVATKLLGRELPLHPTSPDLFWSEFVRMCILAPTVEEGTYRVGLCCGAVGLLKPAGAIAASGLVFGALHVLYGNPGPDNLVAGFFLAWAYFRSGSILVPMALHALGNLCVLASWIALWYTR
jgi:membrane protease YdiL (CAAX protease family)